MCIHRENELGIIITNLLERSEFSRYSIVGSKEICNLYIYPFTRFLCDEVDFQCPDPTDRHGISASNKLIIDDIFEYLTDIFISLMHETIPDTDISKIVLRIQVEEFLSLNILPTRSMEEKCLSKVFEIITYRLK